MFRSFVILKAEAYTVMSTT